MLELLIAQVLDKWLEIRSVRSYKNSHIEVRILLKPQSKVISLSENFDSIRHVTNSSHQFLISSRGCSSASNFSVKTGSNHQADSKFIATLGISSGHRPHHVACGISDSLTDRISSFLLLEDQRIPHQSIQFRQLLWRNEISSDKFSNGQANSMLNLRRGRQVKNVIQNIQDHILTQSTWNFTQSFCGLFSHSSLLLSQTLNYHVNNEFQIFLVHITIVFNIWMQVFA